MVGTMVYRLRVSAVDDPHMQRFREAMDVIQNIEDNRGYNHIAGFHGIPNWHCWHNQHITGKSGPTRLFLPWHRAYLWWLEQALQDFSPGTALPWWDWARDRKIPEAYNEPVIEGKDNSLYRFYMKVPSAQPAISQFTKRKPGDRDNLPTRKDIKRLLKESDWASFSDSLQNYHDMVHVWVGGDMAKVETAGFDPIFYAHHCMIDRIWSLWQVKHGNSQVPDKLLDCSLTPFGKKVRDVLDVQTLGYEYAVSAAHTDTNGEE